MKLSKLLLISTMVSILASLNAYATDNNVTQSKSKPVWENMSTSDVRTKVYNPATGTNKTGKTVILVIGYNTCGPCRKAWLMIPKQLYGVQGLRYVAIRFEEEDWKQDISDFIIEMNKKANLKDAKNTDVPAIYIINKNGNVVGTHGFSPDKWNEDNNYYRYKDPDSHYHHEWPFVRTYNDLRYNR